jgi:glutamyl-tRNA synthetase
MSKKVRVRFAPSPTGPLHIGGTRTALYNYLFAKKHGGDFLLRIEDTDTARTVPGAEEYIIESLKWAGIEPNAGYHFGFNDGALYKQSERNKLGIYKPYVDKLIADGHAYLAFDTPAEIDAMKASMKAAGVKTPFAYGVFTRDKMKNSLSLSAEELIKRAGDPYVVRLKMPMGVDIKFKDLILGDVSVKSHNIDDKVLFKSDGMPTYHLANVVDDHLMEITHVIRGSEWGPSAPFHVHLWKCLGWEDSMPEFAHLPLIMGPNGKLSKRDGDTLGFPVYPMKWTDPATGETSSGYKESGYLTSAFNNMIALLGWSPGGNIEIMSMDVMTELFSFEKVGKSGAKFDLKKAEWVNAQHMLVIDNEVLGRMWFNDFLYKSRPTEFTAWLDTKFKENPDFSDQELYIEKVCGLLKQKVSNISKFWDSGKYFFVAPTPTNVNAEDAPFLTDFINQIIKNSIFNHDSLRDAFNEAVKSSGKDARHAGMILRMVVTDIPVGPPLFDVMELLGMDESLKRLNAYIPMSVNG